MPILAAAKVLYYKQPVQLSGVLYQGISHNKENDSYYYIVSNDLYDVHGDGQDSPDSTYRDQREFQLALTSEKPAADQQFSFVKGHLGDQVTVTGSLVWQDFALPRQQCTDQCKKH